MEPEQSAPPASCDPREDAVTAAALAVVRRALVESVPVTREGRAERRARRVREDALREVDAPRLGISLS